MFHPPEKTVAIEGADGGLADRSQERFSIAECPRIMRIFMEDPKSAVERVRFFVFFSYF